MTDTHDKLREALTAIDRHVSETPHGHHIDRLFVHETIERALSNTAPETPTEKEILDRALKDSLEIRKALRRPETSDDAVHVLPDASYVVQQPAPDIQTLARKIADKHYEGMTTSWDGCVTGAQYGITAERARFDKLVVILKPILERNVGTAIRIEEKRALLEALSDIKQGDG